MGLARGITNYTCLICFVLTSDAQGDPLGHGRWDIVGGDAEVGAHLVSLNLFHDQRRATVPGHCNKNIEKK